MKLEVNIRPANQSHPQRPSVVIEVHRAGSKISITDAGRQVNADALEVSPGTYSILIGGRSYEVHLAQRGNAVAATVGHREYIVEIADPRAWRRGRGGALEAEGRQEILAPMPGKIVRILATQGAKLAPNQGVLVIEAMKMQNELRSPKSGVLEKLLVVEGQSVNSGDLLAIIA